MLKMLFINVWKKFKTVYNNSLRSFIKFLWRNNFIEMFVNLNICSFDEMLRIFIFGFMSKIIVSNNVLISCYLQLTLSSVFKYINLVG